MNTLGFVAGVVVVAGGAYLLHKKGWLDLGKLGEKIETVGEKMKDSFMEGYQEAAKATG
ncbi:hypothetical protein WDW86_12985 [Bdellovibrionota bacterium FG-2]